jgi:hypothetical protein
VLVLFKVNFTIWAMRAPRYDGPYEVLGEVFHPEGEPVFNSSSETHVRQEDPVIWRDTRGNFHNLDHGKRGHGFSEDGITWHWVGPPTRRAAYTNTLRLGSGEVIRVYDVERPRIWVNPKNGQPELLFFASGGSHQPIEEDGISRGFTVVQRIRSHSGISPASV